MNNFQIKEINNTRVLTTAQLAKAYGMDEEKLFSRFVKYPEQFDKHDYFLVDGEYYWTSFGAYKLNPTDDRANYKQLIDEYFWRGIVIESPWEELRYQSDRNIGYVSCILCHYGEMYDLANGDELGYPHFYKFMKANYPKIYQCSEFIWESEYSSTNERNWPYVEHVFNHLMDGSWDSLISAFDLAIIKNNYHDILSILVDRTHPVSINDVFWFRYNAISTIFNFTATQMNELVEPHELMTITGFEDKGSARVQSHEATYICETALQNLIDASRKQKGV